MTTQMISLQSIASTRMMGMRQSALPLREKIEQALASGAEVEIDFSGIDATQSFIDELVGVLVAKRGIGVIRHLVFKGCTKDVRAIVQFVVAERGRKATQTQH